MPKHYLYHSGKISASVNLLVKHDLLNLSSTLRRKFGNTAKGVRSQNSEGRRGRQIYAEVY